MPILEMMFQPDHTPHPGKETHPDNRAQFLLVADETSLAELEAALAVLPLCARGRVFVEVPAARDMSVLAVPPRMTVTWLPRSARGGAPGTGTDCAPGEAVTRAVRAWAAEMLCDGPDETQVWLSGDYRGVCELHDLLVGGIGLTPGRVTTPAAYRLGVAH